MIKFKPSVRRLTFIGLCLTVLFTINLAILVNFAASEPFFKGKNIRIIVGFSPGGGFDAYSRLFARHLGKHIPGKPKIGRVRLRVAARILIDKFSIKNGKST